MQCGRQRPSCAGCMHRKIKCEYETAELTETHGQALRRRILALSQSMRDHQEIFELLQKAPEDESWKIFQHLREGTEVSAIMKHIRQGKPLDEAIEPYTPEQSDRSPEYTSFTSLLDSAMVDLPKSVAPSPAPSAFSFGDSEFPISFATPKTPTFMGDLTGLNLEAGTPRRGDVTYSADDAFLDTLLNAYFLNGYHAETPRSEENSPQ